MRSDDICGWCGHFRRLHPTVRTIKTYNSYGSYYDALQYCQGELPDTKPERVVTKETRKVKRQYMGKYDDITNTEYSTVEKKLDCKCSEFRT